MKYYSIFLVIAGGVICLATAVPVQNVLLYQQGGHVGVFSRGTNKHAIIQYQPYTLRRSANAAEGGVSAYGAGNIVATGTYLDDCEPADADDILEDDADNNENGGSAVSIAEAFPEENEVNLPQNDEAEVLEIDEPEEHIQNDQPEIPQSDEPEVPVQSDEPEVPQNDEPAIPQNNEPEIPQIDEPETPQNAEPEIPKTDSPTVIKDIPSAGRVPPPKKNKPKVQSNIDDEDDITPILRNNNRPNNFFPVNFGRTSGGAIAVANSFSAGKGGTATSHAIAYGSSSKSKN